MKKLVGFLLVFLLLLAGCESSSQKTVITMVRNKGEIQSGMQKIVDSYNSKSDMYEIQLLPVPSDPAAQQALLLSSESPVIFTTNGESEFNSYKEMMSVIDIPQLEEKMLDGSTDTLTNEGNLMGVPAWIEGFGIIYNKDIFEANNINPDQITTASSFKELCDTLNNSIESCITVTGDNSYFVMGQPINPAFALQENPAQFLENIINGSESLVGNKEFDEWVNFMSVVKEQTPNILETTYDSSIYDFSLGNTAMLLQGNWIYPILEEYAPEFEYGFMQVPIAGNSKISADIAVSFHINNTATDLEIEGASDFLTYMFTDEESKNIIASEFGVVAAYEEFPTDLYDPLSQEVYNDYSSGQTLPYVHSKFPQGIIDDKLFAIGQSYFSGNLSNEEFLKQINDAFSSY